MDAATFALFHQLSTGIAKIIQGFQELRNHERTEAEAEARRAALRRQAANILLRQRPPRAGRNFDIIQTWFGNVKWVCDWIWALDDERALRFNLHPFVLESAILCQFCKHKATEEDFYIAANETFRIDTDYDPMPIVTCRTCAYSNQLDVRALRKVSTLPGQLARATSVCRALLCPPPPNEHLACSDCGEDAGEVYFHCCRCQNDRFVMCLRCALAGTSCLSGLDHQLTVVTRFVPGN